MPVIPSTPTPIPTTVLDVISSAMRLIGVLASGETPSAAEANDALHVLQDMWDQWNAERLMIFTIPRLVFPLVSGQQVYKYGSLDPTNPIIPDFNSPRPANIERVGIIWLANPAQPLELPMQYLTTAQWQALPVKNIQSSLPQYVWDDDAFPFRNFSFWPVPNISQVQVAIYPWQALNLPATLTTVMAFPPGYAKAFRYNLALDLAAEFPPVPPQVLKAVAAIAAESKAIVKSINTPIIDLRCDQALTQTGNGYYDWRSDMPVGGR